MPWVPPNSQAVQAKKEGFLFETASDKPGLSISGLFSSKKPENADQALSPPGKFKVTE
ncbi:hypothetical protein GCM10011405_23870 [Rufibacter glacialis]|nr:hypothetical protein GCM10011405_23870 [Rufibacter glacialis]